MYDKYVQAGGPATLVAFGVFMKDSHNLLGSLEGFPLWMPKVDAFLESVGLPGKLLTARYLPAPAPPASHFAAIDDVNAVPYLNEAGRETYRKFLTRPLPRVFIVIPRGGCAFYNGGYDPQTRGLEECRKTSPNCELYAVDNNVVWVPKEPPAVAAWRASAQAGNVEGERQLGYLYLVGHGVAPNSSESAKWIGLAASQGDLFSQGIAWQYGFGNASDLAKAHDAYQQAAAKGDTLAMYQLSRMGGNEADPAAGTGQSLDWLRKAAEGGLAMAQFRLGGLYLRLDSTQALAWFQRAADAGDAFAQNDLGYLYLKGQVTERDYGKALALFQKASDQGVLASLNEIGNMYAHGWGVPKDDVQALACFRKAAEKGFATAQYSLGFLYQSGLGIAKDDGQARAWFQRAAAQGYRPAKEALVKMDGVPSL